MIWRKILSLTLIPILLWAGMGFLLSRHYCFDELISEHFYHSENSCGMDILLGDEPCHDEHDEDQKFEKSNCCRNEWVQIDHIDTVNHKQQQSIVKDWQPAFNTIVDNASLVLLREDSLSSSNSSPPELMSFLKTRDFLANSQCYLI